MSVRIFYPESSSSFDISSHSRPYRRNSFGDRRSARTFTEFLEKLTKHQSPVINQVADDRNEAVRFYNFLSNDKASVSEVIFQSTFVDPKRIKGKNILAIIDISYISLRCKKANKSKFQKQLGVVADNDTPGLSVCPVLLIDEDTLEILGLADVVLFSTPKATSSKSEKRKIKEKRKGLPFEEKSSSVWKLASTNASEKLKSAARVTFAMDRAGDSYESIHSIIEETGRDFIIRMNVGTNERKVQEFNHFQGAESIKYEKATDLLSKKEFSGQKEIKLRPLNHYSKSSGKRKKRKKRKALLNIRYIPVELSVPTYKNFKEYSSKKFYLVEVKEDPSTVPPGEKPLHWLLLTSRVITSVEDAWAIVKNYEQRWNIEELFRVFKKDGFNIEDTEIDSSNGIKKLLVMTLKASVDAMRLVKARDGKEHIDITVMFDEDEQTVLKRLLPDLEGRTEKQKNPFTNDSLAWAAWIIARLGGWKGYQSQRPPGPVTMRRGLEKFYIHLYSYNLFVKKNKEAPT